MKLRAFTPRRRLPPNLPLCLAAPTRVIDTLREMTGLGQQRRPSMLPLGILRQVLPQSCHVINVLADREPF